MSKYTTEIRFICETACGLSESAGYSDVNDIIASARSNIFSFNYPIFDDEYKSVLETKILKHFYTREIGSETVGLFKLRLDTKMNEIMPYYNKLYESELIEFNPMYAVDLNRSHNGQKNDSGSSSDNLSSTTSGQGSGTSGNNRTDSGNSTALFSDTPQGGLEGLDNNTYLTNATKNNYTDTGSETGTSSNTWSETKTDTKTGSNTLNSTDSYTERVYGYDGRNPSKMLQEFRDSFLNIDMMIINDLEPLFMQIW